MAPRVAQHPGTRPTVTKEGTLWTPRILAYSYTQPARCLRAAGEG
jgi:hypothetical protein